MAVAATLAIGFFGAAPRGAGATSVGCGGDPRARFEDAERVFVGKVKLVEFLYDAPDAMDLPAHMTFEVHRNFKGEGDVVILDAANAAEVGREYVVLAGRPVASLYVGPCDIIPTTTAPGGPATEEAARLILVLETLVGPVELERLNWYLVPGAGSEEDLACDASE